MESIEKIFSEQAITIATSSSVEFLPYAGVLIGSILENRKKNIPIDFIVFVSGKDETFEKRILKDTKRYANCSVRFFEIPQMISGFQGFSYGHFSQETYYKLFVTFFCGNYSKVIFLDADTIVREDISKLWEIDLQGAVIGAVADVDSAGLYNGAMPHKKEYVDKLLKIQSPYKYFQAGVIVYDMNQWRKLNLDMDSIVGMSGAYSWELLDQDIANVLYEGRVFHLPMNWNVLTDCNHSRIKQYISKAPDEMKSEYFLARETPYIIHYAGNEKPWNNPQMDFGEFFWQYARLSNMYETILYSAIEHKLQLQKQKKHREIYRKIKYAMREGLIHFRIIKRYPEKW